jgi:hypothetical protein
MGYPPPYRGAAIPGSRGTPSRRGRAAESRSAVRLRSGWARRWLGRSHLVRHGLAGPRRRDRRLRAGTGVGVVHRGRGWSGRGTDERRLAAIRVRHNRALRSSPGQVPALRAPDERPRGACAPVTRSGRRRAAAGFERERGAPGLEGEWVAPRRAARRGPHGRHRRSSFQDDDQHERRHRNRGDHGHARQARRRRVLRAAPRGRWPAPPDPDVPRARAPTHPQARVPRL